MPVPRYIRKRVPPDPPVPRTAGGVDYLLTRGGVKNINLRVKPDGTVAVSAPRAVPLRTVDAFVVSHREWIAAAQGKAAARRAERDRPLPDRQAAQARFDALRDRYFPYFEQALRGRRPPIKVRDMTSRWGVCHIDKGYITIALRLAEKPEAAQEYVMVHEYCHFLQAGHGPAFWAQVERILPDWRQRRALLKQ